MSCVVTLKPHNLVEIDRRSTGYEQMAVTRWCTDCGGVVVDTDIDGRTMAGDQVRMRFPKLAFDVALAAKR